MPTACASANLAEAIIGGKAYPWRRRITGFDGLIQMRGGEDDEVPVPNCCNGKSPVGIDADVDAIVAVFDSFGAVLLQRQKGVFHRIAVIAQRRVYCVDREHIDLNGCFHSRKANPVRETTIGKPNGWVILAGDEHVVSRTEARGFTDQSSEYAFYIKYFQP